MKRLFTIILVTVILCAAGFAYLWVQDKKDGDKIADKATLNSGWIRENQEKIAKERPVVPVISVMSGTTTGAITGYYYGIAGTTCDFTMTLPYEFEAQLDMTTGGSVEYSGKVYSPLAKVRFYVPTTFTDTASYTRDDVGYYDSFVVSAYDAATWKEQHAIMCDPNNTSLGVVPPTCANNPELVKETANCVYFIPTSQEYPSDVKGKIQPLLEKIDKKAVTELTTKE